VTAAERDAELHVSADVGGSVVDHGDQQRARPRGNRTSLISSPGINADALS
jgi:hypothetical protein